MYPILHNDDKFKRDDETDEIENLEERVDLELMIFVMAGIIIKEKYAQLKPVGTQTPVLKI